MQLLRSLLFVPGNRANMLEKAVGLKPDAVVPDMEDSVPMAEKANAREMVASFLPTLAEAGHQIIPRVNSLNTGLMEDDLAAVVGPHIAGVSVGKVGSASEVRQIADTVGRREVATGIPFGSTSLVLWVETASAIVNAFSICKASKRVIAVAFGGEDLTNDMAIPRTESEEEIAHPRSVVAVAARAAGYSLWRHRTSTTGTTRDSDEIRRPHATSDFAAASPFIPPRSKASTPHTCPPKTRSTRPAGSSPPSMRLKDEAAPPRRSMAWSSTCPSSSAPAKSSPPHDLLLTYRGLIPK